MITKIIFTLALLISIASLHGQGQEWKVPPSKKKKVASFKFTPENLKKGEQIFNTNCIACHGTPGKANFAKINPSPGDPVAEKFQINTDGDLFYKITNGRTPMPSFKNTISEEDRWNVISFLRSFNKKYIQPGPKKDEAAEYEIHLQVSQLKEKNKIRVKATATSKLSPSPENVKNADVTIYVKRRFGNLQVDKKKTTNANGEVFFTIPPDIPGDTSGMLTLVTKLSDETGDFGEAETALNLQAGVPAHPKSLIDTRAMWTVRSRAPVWLILAYCGIVTIVIGCIGYIFTQLLKIRKIGAENRKSKNHE